VSPWGNAILKEKEIQHGKPNVTGGEKKPYVRMLPKQPSSNKKSRGEVS